MDYVICIFILGFIVTFIVIVGLARAAELRTAKQRAVSRSTPCRKTGISLRNPKKTDPRKSRPVARTTAEVLREDGDREGLNEVLFCKTILRLVTVLEKSHPGDGGQPPLPLQRFRTEAPFVL